MLGGKGKKARKMELRKAEVGVERRRRERRKG